MKRIQKNIFRFLILTTISVLLLGMLPAAAVVVPNSQSSTNTGLGEASYRVGQLGDAMSDTGRDISNIAGDAFTAVSDAFQNAFDMFDTGYSPTSHVVNENGYYSQTYSNKSGRNASIYVDSDNNAYSVMWPIYDVWNNVGGIDETGYPTANAYEVGNEYYQNFTNGYVRYTDEDNISFVPSKNVTEQGVEYPYENMSSQKQQNNNLTDNGTTEHSSDDSNNTTGRSRAGTGADGSGVAGSLETVNDTNPIMAIVGVVILAAVVIILVSLSVAASRSDG